MRIKLLAVALLASLAGAYDPSEAMTFLFYSKSAYCPVSELENWSCLPCAHSTTSSCVDTKVFTNEGNGGLVYVNYRPQSQEKL